MKHLIKTKVTTLYNPEIYPSVVLDEATGKVYYNLFSGVRIQHIDGTLYTIDEWTAGGFTADQANGIAVSDYRCAFVMAVQPLSTKMIWCTDTQNAVPGLPLLDTTEAKKDYNGVDNTRKMLAVDTSGAAYGCANYVFPNGKKGYLPAAGECNMTAFWRTSIQNAITLLGGTVAWTSTSWTSTQADTWCAYEKGGTNINVSSSNGNKNGPEYVWPFTTL